MNVQHCEYIKYHFEIVNFMLQEFNLNLKNIITVEQRAGGYGSFICPSQPFTWSYNLYCSKASSSRGAKRFILSHKKGRELHAEDNKAMPKITRRKRMVNMQFAQDERVP